MLLRIKDWDAKFENAASRKLKRLEWIAIPNEMDSEGYTALVDHPNGSAHFGAWVAILKIASRQSPRGSLPAGGGRGLVGISQALGRIARIPAKVFAEVLPRLIDPTIGWVEDVNSQSVNGLDRSDPSGTSGESANVSGESANVSGESANVSGKSANVSGESANVSGESADDISDPKINEIQTMGESADVVGESADVVGESADVVGEFPHYREGKGRELQGRELQHTPPTPIDGGIQKITVPNVGVGDLKIKQDTGDWPLTATAIDSFFPGGDGRIARQLGILCSKQKPNITDEEVASAVYECYWGGQKSAGAFRKLVPEYVEGEIRRKAQHKEPTKKPAKSSIPAWDPNDPNRFTVDELNQRRLRAKA